MPDLPGLQVFTSTQLGPLCDRFVQQLRDDPLPPREPETIVVQSQGMRRWLTLQLADALGCAGSLELPFPAHFSHDIANRVAGGRRGVDHENDPFSRDALTWRLDALLRALPTQESAYERLRDYLNVTDDRMRLGLASRIAARFDEYQLYRPDALLAWEEGRDMPDSPHTRWQASLWRTLCAGDAHAADHLPRRFARVLEALESGTPSGLPPRVTVFGVSTLPPLFLDLLASLARHLPVRVYAAVLDEDSLHPIAGAFGAQSRELLHLLRERGASISRIGTPKSSRASLLATLHQELASSDRGDSPLTLSIDDPTLRIHDAHGQVRQLEVVRNQLLDALAADATLRPHDLLLLVPDAAEWAPMVDAVFGVSVDDTPRLPFNIADRPRRSVQPAADALLRMLALEGGRFARSEVFGLLEHPLVRQGAGLADTEIEELRTLTERANIRWGYDAASRRALGLPAYEEASWRTGLDRLLLGSVAGRGDDPMLGVLPEAGDTAGDPETLGRLAAWVDELSSTLTSWSRRRPVAEWSAALLKASQRFMHATDRREQQTLGEVEGVIRQLGALAEVAGHHDDVSFGVVRDWLETQLTDDGFGTGFLIGGMTVAALKPMRSIPFRIIAVVGLDDETFPRRDRRAAFDLLALERRVGDRDLRGDDRQLFLDLLLAALDRLILTFGGRAVHDNSRRAPSVVLDELLGHLDRRSGGAARKLIVVEHPLQPFAQAYFAHSDDPRLFTFSQAEARAALARSAQGDVDRPFVAGPIEAEAATAPRELTLNDLADLWTNPSKYFCKRVLRLSLDAERDEVADEELFALDVMTQGLVKSRMLGAGLAGRRDPVRERRRLEAEGLLPPGELASSWYSMLSGGVDEVLARVPAAAPSAPFLIAIDHAEWRLTGRIDGIRGNVRVVARAGNIRPEHRIRAWVQHVAMCAARDAGIAGLPDTTLLMGKDAKNDQSIGAVPNAMAVLAGLIGELAGGRCAPLPFFPQAGWAWFEAVRPTPGKKPRKGAAPKDPIALAKAAYAKQPSDWDSLGGDGEDAYVSLCFRGSDPMASRWREFERLASLLFSAWPPPAAGA